MSSPRFQHFISGYLYVAIRGAKLQDVLLAMQQRGVTLYQVAVRGNTCTLGLSLRDFESFYQECRRHRVKIRFINREGLPFLVKKLRKRKVMVAGVAVFVALIYGLGSMVWQVNVSGVDDESRLGVLQAAKDSGVYPGAWKQTIGSVTDLQSKLIGKLPNVMWVGVQVSGSKVNIEAVPKIPEADKLNTEPHDVVAGKPGVIRQVFANRGSVVVKPGQVVHAGDIVISGSLAGGTKYVPAEGQVLAEVWYRTTVTLPLNVQQSALTGEKVKRDYLSVGPLAVRIWGWEQPDYSASVERTDTTDWKIWNWPLPIQRKEVTVYQVSPETIEQSREEANRKALEIASQDVRTQMHGDGEILSQTVLQSKVEHGKLYESILTKTEEDIGVVSKLKPPTQDEASQTKQS